MAGSLLTAGLSQLVLVISGVLVARSLGPQDRGYLALIVLVVTILTQLGNLGLPLAATYYIAGDRSRAMPIARFVLPAAVVQTVVIIVAQLVIFWIVLADEPERVKAAGLLSLAALPGILAQQYGLAVFQGLQRFGAFNVLRMTPPVMYALGVVTVFVLGIDHLVEIASVWVAAQAGVGLVTLGFAWTCLPTEAPQDSAPSHGQLMRFGLKSFIGYVSPVSSFRLDQAVIALFLTPVALGLYVVSLAFTNLPRFVAQSIGMVAYPSVASVNDPQAARRRMWRYVGLAALISVLLIAPLEMMAGVLVRFFFGDEFAGAESITRILLLGTLFVGVRRVLADGARGAGYPGLGTVAEVASWMSFLPALALLLPLGVRGVALALCFAWGFSLLVLVVGVVAAERRRSVAMLTSRAVQNANRALAAVSGVARSSGAGVVVAVLCLLAGSAVALLPYHAVLLILGLTTGALAFGLARSLISRQSVAFVGVPPSFERSGQWDEAAQSTDFRLPRMLYYLGLISLGLLTVRPIFPITVSDWLFLASLGAMCVQLVVRRVRTPYPISTLLFWGVSLFAIGGLLSTFESHAAEASIAVILRIVYLTIVWFWLGSMVLQRRRHVYTAVVLWVISAAVSSFGAVLQLFFGDVIPGTDPVWGRMTGFTQHMNDLGGLTAVALIPALMVALRPSRRLATRLIGYVPFLLVFTGLILSGSVGGLLAAGVATFLWFCWGRTSVRTVAVLVVIAIGAGVLFSQRAASASLTPLQRISQVTASESSTGATLWSRVDTYRAAVKRVEQNPLVGVGLDDVSSTIDQYEPHNLVIGTWFKAGIIGLVGMLLIIFAIAKTGWLAVRDARVWEDKMMAVALLCAFAAFVTYSMSAPILYTRYGWISAALLVALRAVELRAPSSASTDIVPMGKQLSPVRVWSGNTLAQWPYR
jgi:O-antigen/teichoic acid export membrane protein/O-antigen ligase